MRRSLNALTALAKRLHPHTRGRLAEHLALLYFLLQGYRPAPRPARALAQTDLLLRRGHSLVLVEVKFRTRHGFPPLSPAQQQRLWRQARALAARYPNLTVRLDLCYLTLLPPRLTHLRALDPNPRPA
jgi:Holliday junction resolvase-like predicted endonuclease